MTSENSFILERLNKLGCPFTGHRQRENEYALFDDMIETEDIPLETLSKLVCLICFRLMRDKNLLNLHSVHIRDESHFLEWLRTGIDPEDIIDTVNQYALREIKNGRMQKISSWKYIERMLKG